MQENLSWNLDQACMTIMGIMKASIYSMLFCKILTSGCVVRNVSWDLWETILHGPLTRYVKLRVAHAPGMPETFLRHRLQRKPLVSHHDMHHNTCVTHVPWCTLGSLTHCGGENFSDIPGACATRNFSNLVRGPWNITYVVHRYTLIRSRVVVSTTRPPWIIQGIIRINFPCNL